MYYSISDLGYTFAYNIDVFCTKKNAKRKITVNDLTHDQIALNKNVNTLLDFRSGCINIDGLIM